MILDLSNTVQNLLKEHFKVTEVSVQWSRPQEISHGDLATPVALQLAKEVGQNPAEIAKVLADGLAKQEGILKVEVAGAGYVNVWLDPVALVSLLDDAKGFIKPQASLKEPPVIVDYSSPNIAKPLGIHHILSTVIGQAIVNLHQHLGYETVSINHIGDWGTQYGKLAVALQKFADKPLEECSLDELMTLYVKFHEEAEGKPELEDEARAAFKKLEEGDKEMKQFWEQVVEITMKEINVLYERLHVSFDHIHGESFYEDKMQAIIDEGKENKVLKEGKEGALVVEFPEDDNLPPAVAVKGDGATIYLTRDLATARYRIDTWHPQAMLYVVDVAQSLYFQQLFESLKQYGWELPKLEHVVFGRMSFTDRKMSTRKGNIIKLEEVLDAAVKRAEEVIKEHGDKVQTDNPKDLAEMMGIGSVAYGILSQNRKQNLTFDWDRVLSFEGNSAPYLQYTYARARSVVRKSDTKNPKPPKKIEALTDKERSLIGALRGFGSALEEARANYMPHMLATYLYQLAQDFNAFYNDSPILDAPELVAELRLALTDLTAEVLGTGLQILTLRVPERM